MSCKPYQDVEFILNVFCVDYNVIITSVIIADFIIAIIMKHWKSLAVAKH